MPNMGAMCMTGGNPGNNPFIPYAVIWAMEASFPGTYTIYLIGDIIGGSGSVSMLGNNLSTIYTQY
jgi:hypothetical protein